MARIYWGDLHSHCDVSYGTGSLERALRAAAGHLDFASVTGHANWPDMPRDRARYGAVIDYHLDGFERLARRWREVQTHLERHHRPGSFVPILSTEWHSIAVGDHNVYYPRSEGPIADGSDLVALAAAAPLGAILVPHHIGYGPGARGIDWDAFDAERSPVVEVVSTHGASDEGAGGVASFHTMGPFHAAGGVEEGLRRGHRFGFVGGTDHHAGYPGHHGGGRTAVIADALTRDAIFDALRARRCYAATGDAIELAFEVDGAPMGGVGTSLGDRRIRAAVRGADGIVALELLRNGRVIAATRSDASAADMGTAARATRADMTTAADRASAADRAAAADRATAADRSSAADRASARRWKVRLEWGWGEKDQRVDWRGEARILGGRLIGADPVFRGEEVIDPRDAHRGGGGDEPAHAILGRDDGRVGWRSVTHGNPHPRVPSTAGIVLEVEGDDRTMVEVEVNDLRVRPTIGELARGSIAHRLRGWLSEALLLHRAVPDVEFTASLDVRDAGEQEVDAYRVRVLQANGERAWSSPIWIERR